LDFPPDNVTASEPAFKSVGIVGKPDDPAITDALLQLHSYLVSKGIGTLVDERVAAQLGDVAAASLQDLGRDCDLVIIVGGDGTLLHTARELVDTNVRVLGVNRGRLGFLADIAHDQIHEALDQIFAGNYEDDPRFLLDAEVFDANGDIRAASRALNDVVIHKWNTARMIEFEIWIDGRFVETQRSDGMIISTPTGSTAYALSGGGPLIMPDLDTILLVPICPHTLSNRPIVLGGNAVLELRLSPRTEPGHAHITCDGQTSIAVRPDDRVLIRKAARPVCLIHPAGHDHFDILRAKLNWGGNRH